jgi:sulfate/thiosulfate transport system permease protein
MLVVLFGSAHPFGKRLMFSWPAIILALLFISLPLVVRTVLPVMMELDRDQEEAALTLGASRFATFWRVVFPTLRPAIVSGTLLAFARALGEFGSIVVVSGNIPRRTLTAAVHIFAEMESGNTESAAAMSMLLLVLSFGIIAAISAPATTAREAAASGGRVRYENLSGRQKLLVLAVVAYVGVLIAAPSLAILAGAFGRGIGEFFAQIFQADALRALWLTLLLAAIAVVVNAAFGTLCAYVLVRDRFPGRRLIAGLIDLPSAVSPVIAGYMIILLFGRAGWFGPWFAKMGIRIVFALPAMVIATIFVTLPFVIRAVMPQLEQAGLAQEEAAQTLGATPWQTFWRVTLPNIRWGLLYGVVLTAARALGEFGAVLVVAGGILGVTETATLYIFRSLDERNEVGAYALAVVLGVISVMLLGLIEVLTKRLRRA